MRIRGARLTLIVLGAVSFLAGAPLARAEGHGPKPGAPAHPAAPKAASKPAAAPKNNAKKGGGARRVPRKAGSEAGEPNEATRRIIAGTAGRTLKESAELTAMRELDLALFPGVAPSAGAPWIAEGTPLIDRGEPRLLASGMPPEAKLAPPPSAEPVQDLSWLRQLAMPDIPVRWDARVIRYLDYYKNNPRGRSMVQLWIRKSGRYGGAIRRILREQGLPEDILWLSLVESGFDPTIQSPAGAAGLWQFMPEGARIYGLTVDRWVDERLDPERSTVASARYLADLRQRFGGWELAFAAYNMGYGGLLSSIRKYNTNDFWELSRLESGMPFETALYVPKIVAMAIVARNKKVFGCEDTELDPSINFDKVAIRSGVSLRSLALAAGSPVEKLLELNPQLLAARAPPLGVGAPEDASWTVKVPPGTAPRAAKSLSKLIEGEAKLTRYAVRWGESLEEIAARLKVSRSSLQALNGLRRDELLRPGTVLFLPAGAVERANLADPDAPKPVVVVPDQAFSYPDRRRVFYRVMPGDTLRELAPVLGVTADELCRWNLLDPNAALHEGMSLQVFSPKTKKLDEVRVLDESLARVLPVGTTDFFTYFEAQRGRKRVEMVARDGDTWRSLAQKNGLTMGQIERINHRARSSALRPGDKYVVYVSTRKAEPGKTEKEVDPYEDAAVAVAKPIGDAAEKGAEKEQDGVMPAALKKAVEPESAEDKVPEAGKVGEPSSP